MQPPHDFHVIVHLGDLNNRPGGLLPVDGAFYLNIDEGPYRNGGESQIHFVGRTIASVLVSPQASPA